MRSALEAGGAAPHPPRRIPTTAGGDPPYGAAVATAAAPGLLPAITSPLNGLSIYAVVRAFRSLRQPPGVLHSWSGAAAECRPRARAAVRAARRVTQSQHRLRAAHGRAGVRPIRIHDLRHTCATLLLARRLSWVVMDILGHSQIAVTMNVYAHVIPAMQQEAVEHLDAALARADEEGKHDDQ